MGQTAFVFPGQGSQEVGMLGDLLAVHEQVAETFAEASEVLGYDLRKLMVPMPWGFGSLFRTKEPNQHQGT